VNKVLQLLVFCTLWLAVVGVSKAQSSCSAPADVRVGFFNGVMNDWHTADYSRQKLELTYGLTASNGAAISYELYYNTTQGFTDFVETFSQRLREQDAALSDKFYLFYEAINGGGEFTDIIRKAVPAYGGFVDSMVQHVQAKIIADLGDTARLLGGLSNYESIDSGAHASQMKEVIKSGKRFLIVAHSQGNLYANLAYKYYIGKTSENAVRVVHIAPASPEVNGPWTLANLDRVINGLRALGSAVDVTDKIPEYAFRPPGINNKTDILGHGLLEIYLNRALSTRQRIDGHFNAAIEDLSQRDVYDTHPGPCVKITKVICDDGATGERRWTLEGKAKAPVEWVGLAILPVYRYDDGSPLYGGYFPSIELQGATSRCISGGWDSILVGVYGINACARWRGGPVETKWTSSAVSQLKTGQDSASAKKTIYVQLYKFPSMYYDSWYVHNGVFPSSVASTKASVKVCPAVYNIE